MRKFQVIIFFFSLCYNPVQIDAKSHLTPFVDKSLTRIYRGTFLIADQYYYVYFTRKKTGYYIQGFIFEKIGKIWTTNSTGDFFKLSISIYENQIHIIGLPLATNRYINKNGQIITYWQRYKPKKITE